MAAVFTELWGPLVLVGPDLICVEEAEPLTALLEPLRAAGGGSLAGLPDVLGLFQDGRVIMREAKNIATRDRLSPSQHAFACRARELFGDRLDLAVVQWGGPRSPARGGVSHRGG